MVESILGKPKVPCTSKCAYEIEPAQVIISYSKEPCKGESEGWNVPSNTVVNISVVPVKKIPLVLGDDDPMYYTAERIVIQKKGIIYDVDRLLGLVNKIRYVPIELNNNLRCNGFPPYNPAGSIYLPESSFTKKNIEEARGILDVFLVDVLNRPPSAKTYLITYAGKDISDKEYLKLFEGIKRYVYKKRKISPELFEIINGGRRDTYSVEVFYLQKTAPPPVPSPNEVFLQHKK